MLLYDNPISGNCYKVRLLLAHLGIACERKTIAVGDRSKRGNVLEGLNPAHRIPTLVLDDGRPIAESNAILWYLGDGTRYVPDDRYERAQVLQWLFFEQYEHEPNVAVARYWLRYRDAPVDREALAARRAGGHRALAAMEAHLSGRSWLAGDRYSIADISLYAYTHVAHEGEIELAAYPAILAWLGRVAEQPGHVTIDA